MELISIVAVVILLAFAVIGLMSNFFFIFFMDENDRLNEEYLENENNH